MRLPVLLKMMTGCRNLSNKSPWNREEMYLISWMRNGIESMDLNDLLNILNDNQKMNIERPTSNPEFREG